MARGCGRTKPNSYMTLSGRYSGKVQNKKEVFSQYIYISIANKEYKSRLRLEKKK